MSGMWKRSHGRTSEAPPDERGGYRYVRPTATAPHLDSTHARADEVLLTRIKTVPISSRQTYGAPRVDAELRATGGRHGRKRIAQLMRAAGLVGAGAAARSRRSATNRRDPRPIWWTATSRRTVQTGYGSRTSPTSRPRRASSTWQSSWMSGAAGWSVGRWQTTCEPSWFWTP